MLSQRRRLCGVNTLPQLVPEDDGADTRDTTISGETVAQVRKALDMMPNRQIIDFLVRYFVTEVNWYRPIPNSCSSQH